MQLIVSADIDEIVQYLEGLSISLVSEHNHSRIS